MNGVMGISVIVTAGQARAEIAKLQAQMAGLNRANASAGAVEGIGGARQMNSLVKYGNALQYTGRQLFRNFGLPLIAVGALGMKFALDQEKAMVHVKKVYGDAAASQQYWMKQGMSANQAQAQTTKVFANELKALDNAFTSLSEKYAIQKKDVEEVAGAWAAAGVSGLDLAKSVENTMVAMKIGDMSAVDATTALISIQAQYNLSSTGLTKTLAQLNAVENATAADMGDLITAFSKSAGVARTYGVDTRHLAADIAALVPASGSAATAGNALKTIFSRLMSPTNATADALKLVGINADSKEWAGSSAQERLVALSNNYNKLDDNTRAYVGTVIAGRWQISRFDILMREFGMTTQAGGKAIGNYQKALNATKTTSQIFATEQRELNAILESSPNKLARVGVALQNSLADIVQPLLPYIISLASVVADAVKWFQTLSPEVQKIGIYLGVLLIILPLITIYLGSVSTLLGVMGKAAMFFGSAFVRVGSLITGAMGIIVDVVTAGVGAVVAAFGGIGLAIAAVVIVAMAIFHKQVAQGIQNVANYIQGDNAIGNAFRGTISFAIKMFNLLPQGIQGALIATVNVVKQAALAVYSWFSYLNPWAHHSPSLVENVRTGMAAVINAFSSLKRVEAYVKSAYNVIKGFGAAVAGMISQANRASEAADRASIVKFSGAGAGKEYDALISKLHQLESTYTHMGAEIAAAEAKLSVAEKARAAAANQMAAAQREMAAAQRDLDAAMAPSNAAIHDNEIAQKKLQLQILQTTEVITDNTDAINDAKSKLDELNGAQEILKGTEKDLQNAGAGSEVTNFYDQQIAQLESQRAALDAMASQTPSKSSNLDPLNAQLDALQKAGQILQLQQDIDFDPQKQAIEAMQKGIDAMGVGVDNMDVGIDQQQDAIDAMKEKYDLVGDAIQAIKDQLQAATGAAQQLQAAIDAKKAAKKKASAGGGGGVPTPGDFPNAGGPGVPSRTDYSDQSDAINKFADDMAKQTAKAFSAINPFTPLKQKAGDALAWIQKKARDAGDATAKALSGIGGGSGGFGGSIINGFQKVIDISDTFAQKVSDGASMVSKIIGGIGFGHMFDEIGKGLKNLGSGISDGLGSVGKTLGPLFDALGNLNKALAPLYKLIGYVAAAFGGLIVIVLKLVAGGVGQALKAMFSALGLIFKGIGLVLGGFITIITGIINVFASLLTSGGSLSMFFTGLGQIFSGVGQVIWGVIQLILGALQTFAQPLQFVIGIFQAFADAIIGAFQWLYDVLLGHSIIPDIVDGITYFFGLLITLPQWIWDYVLKPIYEFFKSLWDNYISPALKAWWGGIVAIWNALKALGQWVWDNILKPVYDKFKSVWDDYIKPALGTWWAGITTALKALTTFATWIWDNALKPAADKFHDFINDVGGWIKDNAHIITDPFKGILNFVIKGVNTMTGGLNKVADVLPGLSWHIDPIPGLAQGGPIPGRRVGNGFVTHGARAIVGEGKQNHPEYVIPTDPTHRARAKQLFASLGTRLGVNGNKTPPTMETPTALNAQGVPMYGIGGVLSGVGDAIGSAAGSAADLAKQGVDWVAEHARDAASALYNPIGAVVDHMIDQIKWKYAHDPVQSAHNEVKQWIKGADDFYSKVADKMDGGWAKPLSGGYSIGGGINSYPGHNGQDFPVAIGTPVHAVTGGTVTSSRDIGGPGGYTSYGRVIEIQHANGLKSLYAHNSLRVAQTGDHVQGGDVISRSGSTGNSTGPHLHLSMWQDGSLVSPLSVLSKHGIQMGDGGIVSSRVGGTLITAGEAGQDEAVIPLPNGWQGGGLGGGTENHFHGDLVFPNVKDGSDAEDFINNLKSVVK